MIAVVVVAVVVAFDDGDYDDFVDCQGDFPRLHSSSPCSSPSFVLRLLHMFVPPSQ